MKTCPKCGVEHNKAGAFCSRSCANSRERSPELREKLSQKLKGCKGHSLNKGKQLKPRVEKTCKECGNTFQDTESSQKKYCSKECSKKHIGGYREGSGRAKSGYYKGIYCGSTYELAWVIYNIDHAIPFTRFQGILEYDGKKYIPDFLQYGKIIEIKGYESEESVDLKTKVANEHGYEVVVLRKDQLQQVFEYVKQTYSSDFYKLYDEYKPKFQYICSHCKLDFFTDKKRNTETVFCSRACSLPGIGNLYRKENSKKVSETMKRKHKESRDAAGVATSPSN